MTTKILLSLAAVAALTFTGCGGGGSSSTTETPATEEEQTTQQEETTTAEYTTPSGDTLSGDITTNTHLTNDKTWIIDGLVVVAEGATLKIDAGTTIAGKDGTGAATSYIIVDKGAKILAEGTETNPIIFTSTKEAVDGEEGAVGQWGGITLIGKAGNDQVKAYEANSEFEADDSDLADNSGVLKHVKILNSGITMAQDKEINGLSLVGVGSGTTIENITVEKSDDDCVELWGGTVNLTNVTVRECTDDQFDIDDGYSGTVKGLDIHQTATNSGNAGIEMSGTTAATFDGFTIVQDASNKEGGIFFKKDGIGGHFMNGTVTDNSDDGAGTVHSLGVFAADSTSFENVTLAGTSADNRFTDDAENGGSAAEIEAIFDAGTGNSK